MSDPGNYIDLPMWIPPALLGTPLFVFISLMLMGRIVNKFRGIYATVLMFAVLSISVYTFFQIWQGNGLFVSRYDWFTIVTGRTIDFNLHIDSIAALFIVIVLFTAFLVHLFSIEYLRGDVHFEKYFSYLGLFIFSILGIILSQNLFVVFVFWELVGFSSYLLIGFYYKKKTAVYANKKAFLVNRVGDVGFIVGLLTIYSCFGTFNIDELLSIFKQGAGNGFDESFLLDHNLSKIQLWIIGGGVLSGAVAKSAQFPLSVWLPNAMEGPTPVSALLHAATMVAAGVYLLIRTYFFFIPDVLDLIAFIGAITAVMGAFTAMSQTDLKKVLAFSTISQLGYMFMAIGVRSADIAMYHLMTHAFFKACLFLGAGAIIHSMHKVGKKLDIPFDGQDMRLMGGLYKKMPVVFVSYVIATAALVGLPFTSGGLSKEAIITATVDWGFSRGGICAFVPIFAILGTFLTAFYMTRQVVMVFLGENRLIKKFTYVLSDFSVPRGPILMNIPIVVLALLSIWILYSPNPFNHHSGWYEHIKVVFTNIGADQPLMSLHSVSYVSPILVQVVTLAVATLGILLGFLFYGKHNIKLGHSLRGKLFNSRTVIYQLSYNNWYLDQLYEKVFISPILIFSYSSTFFDKVLIEGLVTLVNKISLFCGDRLGYVDQNIFSKIIDLFAQINVIFAAILGFTDRFFIDGTVRLTGALARSTGRVIKGFQLGSVQSFIGTALLGLTAIMIVIYLIA